MSETRDGFWFSGVGFAAALLFTAAHAQLGMVAGEPRPAESMAMAFGAAIVVAVLGWAGSARCALLRTGGVPVAPLRLRARWPVVLVGAIVGGLLAASFAAVVHGALASEARVWDGFVCWELRAKQLEPQGSATPLDPAVFALARNYPVLLPVLGADLRHHFGPGAERFASHVVFAGWLLLIAGYARAIRLGALRGWLLAGAFGLTPMLYSTGSGGIDSGYAEVLMGYVLTACAVGLALRHAPLLGAAAALLVWSKPEGAGYAAGLLLVTALATRGRALHWAASLGVAIGLGLWLPLRDRLGFADGSPPWLAFAAPAAAIAAKEALLRWPALRRRWRWLLPALALLGFALLFVLREPLAASASPLARDFLAHPQRMLERLGRLPEIVPGVGIALVEVNKYGLVFVLLLGMLAVPRLRTWRPRPRSALAFVLLGLALCVVALLLGPEADLAHELDSRFDRLLLHWVGPAWIVLGPWLSRALPGQCTPCASTSSTASTSPRSA